MFDDCEFALGDVVSGIGDEGCKYVVEFFYESVQSYLVRQIVPYSTNTTFAKAFFEKEFVKVGHWDFTRNREVEDEGV